ncbi:MAG: GerMN domain-containing protein, partial [Spirochaetales bacterium]|nr:GerMN domain-containing protein [Spirochaetales bacterium]
FVEVVFEERSGQGREEPRDGGEVPQSDQRESTPPPVDATDRPETSAQPDPPEEISLEIGEPEVVAVAPPERADGEPTRTLATTLFFIRVSDDGRIIAESVERTIRYEGGPLTGTIEALIAGPDSEDLNRGLLSLVPQQTELLSARVASGVAFLNFNEAFRFNPMGLEGYLAQMQQIVLTATQFITVDAVQILINGQSEDYLGGDGVYIGEPLRPSDFRN